MYISTRRKVLSFVVAPLAPALAHLLFLVVVYRGMNGSLNSIIGAARFSLFFIYPICFFTLIFGGAPILALKTPRDYQLVIFVCGTTVAVVVLFLGGVLNMSWSSIIFHAFALATMYPIFIRIAGAKKPPA